MPTDYSLCPSDGGGPSETRKKSHNEIALPLSESQWCNLFVNMRERLQLDAPDLPWDAGVTKVFARLKELCSDEETLKSLDLFESKYFLLDTQIKAQGKGPNGSDSSKSTVDWPIKCMRNPKTLPELFDFVDPNEQAGGPMISQEAPLSGEQPLGHHATVSILGSGENISNPACSISTAISPDHGISPNSSVGAPHTEGFPPILSPVRENMLAEESWREEIYGGALNEYLAPLPRHTNTVDVVDPTVTTQPKEPRELWPQETLGQNPIPGRRIFSSPPPGARSGIPRSTGTLGKNKELPAAPTPGVPRRSLGEAAKAQRATSASTLRNNTLAVEAKQMKPGLLRPLRTPPANAESQLNPPKPTNRKTHPAARIFETPKPKSELGKPVPATWATSKSVPGHIGSNDILLGHAPPTGHTGSKNKESLAPMRTQGLPHSILTRSSMGKVVSLNLKKLQSPTCSPDRRHARVSITPSLLSSGAMQVRGFSSSVSYYDDASFLREDSSSTLLSAATNSSGDIVTLAQGYPGNAASVGFLAGSAKLIKVSKSPTDLGASPVGPASCEIVPGDTGTVSPLGPRETPMERELPVPETAKKEIDKTAVGNPELSENSARPRAQDSSKGYGVRGCDAMPRGANTTKADARKLVNGTKVIKVASENKGAAEDERLKVVPTTKVSNSGPPASRHQTARGAGVFGRRKDGTTGVGKELTGGKGPGSAAGRYHRRTSSDGSGGATKSTSSFRTVESNAIVTPSSLRRGNAPPSITLQDKATSDTAGSPGRDYTRPAPNAKSKAHTTSQPARVTTALPENIKPHPSPTTINRGASRSVAQSFGNKAVSKVLEERHFNRGNPPISQSIKNPKPGNDAGFKSDAAAKKNESASTTANAGPSMPSGNKAPAGSSSSPKAGAKCVVAKDRVTMGEGAQKVPEIVIRSPEIISQATRNVLGDLSSICSGRNPEAILSSGRWFGRRSLTPVFNVEGASRFGESKKGNYLVQAGSRLTPRKSSKAKSMSLMNIASWLHKSPKAGVHDGLFTKRIKKEKIGGPTLLSSTSPGPAGVSVPVLPPLVSSRPISLGFTIHPANQNEHKREFPNDEVEVLINRLSAQLPQTPDEINGFNALGGRYYTEDYTPNLDVSPSKEGNPIAVCMNLIDAAIKEPQSPRRERLLQMSSILVDAVSKSRDAECAAEEAKMAATRAKCAFLETRKHLQELTDLMAARKGAAGGGGSSF